MTKQLKLSALIVALMASTSAFATKPGYAVDRDTDSVIRNNYQECWRTDYFDKATDGLVECGDATAAVDRQPTLKDEKIVLSANFLFGFDKATLRPEASSVLDPIVAKLAGAASVHLDKVVVTGHTDFIGAVKYNKQLSERRAVAVSNYLVSRGVDRTKIEAFGVGKSQTKMTEVCQAEVAKLKTTAAKRRQALIACIEPDRRVEIDVKANVQKLVK